MAKIDIKKQASPSTTPAAGNVYLFVDESDKLSIKLSDGNVHDITYSTNLGYLKPVINFYDPSTSLPASPSKGNRYIASATGNGWTIHNIYEYNGSAWVSTTPTEGQIVTVTNPTPDEIYIFDGSTWTLFRINEFKELVDTPSSYTGNAGKIIGVNSSANAVEFLSNLTYNGTTGVLDYTSDLSSSYTDRTLVDKGYVTSYVGSVSGTFTNLTDTPSAYAGANRLIAINTTNNGLGFISGMTYNTSTGVFSLSDLTRVRLLTNTTTSHLIAPNGTGGFEVTGSLLSAAFGGVDILLGNATENKLYNPQHTADITLDTNGIEVKTTLFKVDDKTRDRLSVSDTTSTMVAPNGTAQIVLNNTEINLRDTSIIMNDETRNRMVVNSTETQLYSPNGSKTIKIVDTAIEAIDGSLTVLSQQASGTYIYANNNQNYINLANQSFTFRDGTRDRLLVTSGQSSMVSPNGTKDFSLSNDGSTINGNLKVIGTVDTTSLYQPVYAEHIGLRQHIDFDEIGSNMNQYDRSGNNYDVGPQGGSNPTVFSTGGPYGGSYGNFNGSGDYYGGSQPITGTTVTAFTYEAYFSPTAASQGYLVVNYATHIQSLYYGGDDKVSFNITFSDGTPRQVASEVLPPDSWYHVVGTYDGTTMKLYVNGELVSTESAPATNTVNFDTGLVGYFIGGSNFAGTYYQGKIVDVKVYDRAIHADEIRTFWLREGGRTIQTNNFRIVRQNSVHLNVDSSGKTTLVEAVTGKISSPDAKGYFQLGTSGDLSWYDVDNSAERLGVNFASTTLRSPTNAMSLAVHNDRIDCGGTAGGFIPPLLTTAQRDAITTNDGATIFNEDTRKMEMYNSFCWVDMENYCLHKTFTYNVQAVTTKYTQYIGTFDSSKGPLDITITDSGSVHGASSFYRISCHYGQDPTVSLANEGTWVAKYKIWFRHTTPPHFEVFFTNTYTAASVEVKHDVYVSYPGTPTQSLSASNDTNIGEMFTLFKTRSYDDRVAIGTFDPEYFFHIKSKGAQDCVMMLQPGEWNSTGDYATLYIGDTSNYIRGEYGAGLNLVSNNAVKVNGNKITTQHDNEYDIYSESDLTPHQSGNVIVITSGTKTFNIHNSFSTNYSFYINAGATLSLNIKNGHSLTYTNTIQFFAGQGALRLNGGVLVDNGAGTLFNIRNTNPYTTQIITGTQLYGWAMGSIDRPTIFFRGASIVNPRSPLEFTAISAIKILDLGYGRTNTPMGQSIFQLQTSNNNAGSNAEIVISDFTGQIPTGESLLDCWASLDDNARISISQAHVGSAGGTLFNQTVSASGTFTSVANASIASTTITSVTDNIGYARFHYIGSTLYIGQKVTISGSSTAAYNGDHFLTSTGSGYFEVSNLEYAITTTPGSFTSNSVTINETSTSAVNGMHVDLDTNLSTAYDVGSYVYNKQTNSFQVNATWSSTATGTWRQKSRNEQSKYIEVINSGASTPSSKVGSILSILNVASTSITGSTTWDPLNLGTAFEGKANSRFKLVNSTTGQVKYIGITPLTGILTMSLTLVKSGNAITYKFRAWNFGSGSFDTVQKPHSISPTSSSLSVIIPVTLQPGDEIRAEVQTQGASDSITVTDFEMSLR